MSASTESKDKAVVLLSGGLDSATALALAKEAGYRCYALSFDYGQRSQAELGAARRVVEQLSVEEHKVLPVNLGEFGGSALTDHELEVPKEATKGIPITYVPARNTIFLSFALAWAEVLGARTLVTGINAVDYSGYPDCRPEYVEAFERLANLATKAGVEGREFRVFAPLLHMSKPQIIGEGVRLGVDYSRTLSCYEADDDGLACGLCDSCRLRREGFAAAGIDDPTRYR